MQTLYILVFVSLGVSLVTSISLFLLLNRIRKQSGKSYEVASRVDQDWQAFSTREGDERRRLTERYDLFETATRDRVDRFEKVATNTRERLLKLEQYLKEFFEVELKSVFDSFDKTVSNILEEMKSEMLRGIERIEDIQAFVDSKSFAQDRILDGEGSVYRLLADSNPHETGMPIPASPPEAQSPYATEPGDVRTEKKAPYRLEPDEAE